MIFKTIADIKKVVPIIGSSRFESFTPFIKQAERDFLIPNISKEQYDLLNAAYAIAPATPLASELSALLEKCQEAIGQYLIYLWIPSGQVSIGDNGVRINTTETLKTAFQWQIDDLNRSILKAAGSAMDELLAFLEENKDDYTAWATSAAYTTYKDCFITTTARFSALYAPLGGSRLNFMAIHSAMVKAQEFDILPAIGQSFYDELLEQFVDDNLSAENAKVILLIQKALAPLTMKRAITELSVSISELGILNFNNSGSSLVNQKQPAKDSMISKLEMAAENDGKAYLQKLKEFLSANIGDYATYAASDAYDADTTDQSFKNDSTTTNFFMG